jgi:bifunctional non-homologous end joining protein LigD
MKKRRASSTRKLARYHDKRDFARTPEPAGAARAADGGGLQYVVQRHDATRLHYDFRLEHDGVLKSWAVPKEPSSSTKDRRLAVQVEDHPLDYGGFEGEIPEGQYGAGSVVIWDRGHWTPLGDADEGLRDGKLDFELAGERLKGRYTLVRMAERGKRKAGKDNWLLLKRHDKPVAASLRAAALHRERAAKPQHPLPAKSPARAAAGCPRSPRRSSQRSLRGRRTARAGCSSRSSTATASSAASTAAKPRC